MSDTKRPSPVERASQVVEWWVESNKLKLDKWRINELVTRLREEIENAIQFQWSARIEKVCPKCGGDFLEHGARPSIPGGRTRFNSFQCNKCGDWFYQDDPRHARHTSFDHDGTPCPLCKSDQTNHSYKHSETTYLNFENEENHDENMAKMKHKNLSCGACNFRWTQDNCPFCDSVNTHVIKERLNYRSGRSWWHWCNLHACYNCGRSWVTTHGGSD